FLSCTVYSQQPVFTWKAVSQKIGDGLYELTFTTSGSDGWRLYAPNQMLVDVPSAELQFSDASLAVEGPLNDSGTAREIQSPIFEGRLKVYEGPAAWKQRVRIQGKIPATLQDTLRYSFENDSSFLQEEFVFTVALEGGEQQEDPIIRPAIGLRNPVAPCGDDDTENKSLLAIFLLGFTGGLIALITPCVFPLIPLTVSYFTKRSGNRRKGIAKATWYGFSIFLIYVLLSLPFHLVDSANPEILNNIATNMWVNLVFFVIFILFALSFFGLYELTLPGSFANKVDSKSGINDIWGIFFMALTLAIVSFSCTGPILGSLLAGVSGGGGTGGATQLSFGMAGFGVGLGLPFALFAMFPGWLQSLPKSGGWLTSVKVVLGFLELALAVKFLSNADLVEQWHLLKREIFIGIWVLIGLLIVVYLLGWLRFGNEPRPKIGRFRLFFIAFFGFVTLYLAPGVTNTQWANLKLISGFPPPLCYSVYKNPVNCIRNVQPLHDYEEALARAAREKKPVLIDFTGWACVNCRRMEENVWTDPVVADLMKNRFIVVSLYVDERLRLPAHQQVEFTASNGEVKRVTTVGDKWTNFQIENFYKTSQPQYAILAPDEKALTKTKTYTPDPDEFAAWLQCGLKAFDDYGKK
ncbi:MAG TPA: cytochrome c biogenesis protein CcdA, partial [Flavisolibacter sp.]